MNQVTPTPTSMLRAVKEKSEEGESGSASESHPIGEHQTRKQLLSDITVHKEHSESSLKTLYFPSSIFCPQATVLPFVQEEMVLMFMKNELANCWVICFLDDFPSVYFYLSGPSQANKYRMCH